MRKLFSEEEKTTGSRIFDPGRHAFKAGDGTFFIVICFVEGDFAAYDVAGKVCDCIVLIAACSPQTAKSIIHRQVF